jgi:hypothetical protein
MKKLLIFVLAVVSLGVAQQQTGGSLTAQGATCATSGACISLHFEFNDVASASIQLSGTFTATVQFEASSDGGATWVAISGTPLNSSTAASSATTANTWKFNVASLTDIRARCSAFTSAPTVVVRSSKAVANAIGGGAVYASGLGTSNVIPKGNGAGQLSDSSITDDGTTVTMTELMKPNATSSATVVGGIGTASNGSGINFQSTTLQFMQGAQRAMVLAASGTSGGLVLASTWPISWSNTAADALGTAADTFITKRSAANIRFGLGDVNGVPVAQTISVQNAVTGADLAGSTFTIDAPLGTGAGAGASTKINRAQILASSATAQSSANAFVVCETKILSNTSATTTTIATIGLASNSGGGATVFHSLTATDGTNFDSETQSYNVSFVNKATVMTVSTPTITTSSAANNSGSATIGATVTGASPTISLKVTPVYGTIIPTSVTLYTTIINHGAGAVTCQ